MILCEYVSLFAYMFLRFTGIHEIRNTVSHNARQSIFFAVEAHEFLEWYAEHLRVYLHWKRYLRLMFQILAEELMSVVRNKRG